MGGGEINVTAISGDGESFITFRWQLKCNYKRQLVGMINIAHETDMQITPPASLFSVRQRMAHKHGIHMNMTN